MPYSNSVFIAMKWIKFMGQEMKSRMQRIRFPDPHLINQSIFYSIVHCPLLCSPEFSNQETLSAILTVTSTWMFLNITYNGGWDICNVKLSQFRSQLLMAPLQIQQQLRSLGFLLMTFIELSFKFMVPLITHRTIHSFIFEAPLSNDYFKQENIEYRATKFTINGNRASKFTINGGLQENIEYRVGKFTVNGSWAMVGCK